MATCMYVFSYYLVNFEPKHSSPPFTSLMALLSVSVAIFAVYLPSEIPVYIVPVAAFAILLTLFTNSKISMLATILLIALLSVSLQYKVEAVAVFIIGGIVATFTSSVINYYRRMDMVMVGVYVGLFQLLIILALFFFLNEPDQFGLSVIVKDIIWGFASGIASGAIAFFALPMIENTFKIITPYGLAELADHNQPLLRRLQFEAPGTYHHSLMVSNLAEAATESIGANPVLARVGALYHDIGKLKRPLFFIENQSYFGIEKSLMKNLVQD
ncbi:MAG: HDIG domain-containing protein [Desulfobacterales bacterium]|nr:HDIG domain-containing protein [Desulfobacterales bacterium]